MGGMFMPKRSLPVFAYVSRNGTKGPQARGTACGAQAWTPDAGCHVCRRPDGVLAVGAEGGLLEDGGHEMVLVDNVHAPPHQPVTFAELAMTASGQQCWAPRGSAGQGVRNLGRCHRTVVGQTIWTTKTTGAGFLTLAGPQFSTFRWRGRRVATIASKYRRLACLC